MSASDGNYTVKLWCFVRRHRSVFSVDISLDAWVTELKEAIYREMRFDVRGEQFAPSALTLHRALFNGCQSMTDEHSNVLKCAQRNADTTPMAPATRIRDHFFSSSITRRGVIDVFVKLPRPALPPPSRQQHIVTLNVTEHTLLLPGGLKQPSLATPSADDSALDVVRSSSHSWCVAGTRSIKWWQWIASSRMCRYSTYRLIEVVGAVSVRVRSYARDTRDGGDPRSCRLAVVIGPCV